MSTRSTTVATLCWPQCSVGLSVLLASVLGVNSCATEHIYFSAQGDVMCNIEYNRTSDNLSVHINVDSVDVSNR